MNKITGTRIAANGVAYLVTIVFLIPVYVLINLSLRSPSDPTSAILPSTRITFDNFVQAWTTSGLPGAIVTSVEVTAISCLVVLALASMAAYPLARSTSRLSTGAFYVFIIGLLLPFQLALIPLYVQMRDLGLLGSIWALVIVYGGAQMPFSVFLLTTFIRSSVPVEYEEAASVDGGTPLRVFWSVVLPLLRPALGTCLILNAVGIWNDFFTPLIYLAGSSQQTLPLAVYAFVGQYTTNWPLVFASLLISMVPILVLYLIFQRYVIRGFAGGLKG